MGNKFCRPKTIKQAKNTINELVEFLSCGEPSDDEGPNEVQVSPRSGKFVEQHPGGSPSYAGMARYPRPHHPNASPQHQQNIMPGESCVVTYDVGALGGALGHSSSAAIPGQSMVVTGSSAYGANRRELEPVSPPVLIASKPQLDSTQSFDVERPYKGGDQIQIWSTSQQKWCNGTVDKAQGEWVHISYKGPEGRLMSKIMPNGHDHLQHSWSNNVAPPRDPSLGSSALSPQKDIARPSSPGTSGITGLLPNPPAAVCTYKVGDDVEIWSTSQNTWCRGRVDKAEGEWVHISYKGPSGQPMTKLMPNGHEDLRFPSSTYSQRPEKDFLTPVNSEKELPPPPPPASASYKVGDRIEIWSTSQNAWRAGGIGKVDGDWVHVNYQGPDGRPMNKIMPNGHAHLRLQAGFSA